MIRNMSGLSCELPGLTKLCSGKVREIFALGSELLLVATDRISAFDCILPNPIPCKGAVLNQLSAFWFEKLETIIPNHVLETDFSKFPAKLRGFREQLEGRSMIVKKAEPLPVECVVRGYLAGGAWKEYQAAGSVCGHALPEGLRQAERLPETLFTPTTKAGKGHDMNLTWDECRRLLGENLARRVRQHGIELYERGREHAATRGIIVADTKFEFGIIGGALILIDECLTPDSSRFWPASEVAAGTNPRSFDKQFVRDYLEGLDWDKTPPAPALPVEIIRITSEKYREAFAMLTGRALGKKTYAGRD